MAAVDEALQGLLILDTRCSYLVSREALRMIYLIAILGYLFLLTGIGIYKARQVRTKADFSVAGRSLSPWILVCTMLAAWIGTGSIVGNAGKAEQKCAAYINYDAVEKYRNFGGIRIEDDVLVTEAGYHVLGKKIPKSIEEIQTLCSSG